MFVCYDLATTEFSILGSLGPKPRDRRSTRSASDRRREGDKFDSRPVTASQLKTLKMIPAAAVSGARHK